MKTVVEDELIESLVNTYSNMLFRIAYQSVHVAAEAEDIVQDVFMAMIKRLPFDCSEHLKAWLIRVTINKCKNVVNSARRKKTVALVQEHYLLPMPTNQNDQYPQLISAIEKLPPKEQHLIYLFYYEQYSAKQIAMVLKKSENSIFIRLTRVREKLKKYIEEGDKNE